MTNSIPDVVEEESDGVELLSGEEGLEEDNNCIFGSADSVNFLAPKIECLDNTHQSTRPTDTYQLVHELSARHYTFYQTKYQNHSHTAARIWKFPLM